MADLSITSSAVLSSGTNFGQATAGENLATAGLVIFLDANDLDADSVGKAKTADANDTTKSKAVGITVNIANVDQPVLYVSLDSKFTPGATLVKGSRYVLSATGGGKIAPDSDLASGWERVDLFTALDTTTAVLSVNPTGIVL